jgi:DNA-binding NarL/FixJ family response regulator
MSKTVLIAESHKFLLEVLTAMMSLLGFSVVCNTSNRHDIEALTLKTKPQLLLFDSSLPGAGEAGDPDLKQLKAQIPDLKILGLGSQDLTDEIVKRMLNNGFDGYCSKYDQRSGFLKAISALFPDFEPKA